MDVIVPYVLVHIGTCSWNYASWVELVYDQPQPRASDDLVEYAKRYRMVEVDSWFIKFLPFGKLKNMRPRSIQASPLLPKRLRTSHLPISGVAQSPIRPSCRLNSSVTSSNGSHRSKARLVLSSSNSSTWIAQRSLTGKSSSRSYEPFSIRYCRRW